MTTKNYAELIHLFPIYLSKSKMPKVKMMRKKVEAGQWVGGHRGLNNERERERKREKHYYVLLIQEICFSHATHIGEY